MRKRGAYRHGILLAALPLALGSCSTPLSGGGNDRERAVLVDYHYDQYSAVMSGYFPREVSVRQGDTLVFKQTWNGEPHTVTMGTLVDEVFQVAWPYVKDGPPFGGPPKDPALQPIIEKEQALPHAAQQNGNDFAQNGAQPCYLETGKPPSDEATACPKQAQPPFNGRIAYYNSGVLPYQGPDGNTYRVPIAGDARPGTYYYYCTVHGPPMSGKFNVVTASAGVPSQDAVNRAAQQDVKRFTDFMTPAYTDAKAGKVRFPGNQAGVEAKGIGSSALTEFVPRTIHAKRGEKVTWHVVGDGHTVSFNVPRYGPEISIGKDGSVHYTPQTISPVGGPGFPDPGAGDPNAPPKPVSVDAGSYDGTHFLSSGIGGPSGGPGGPPPDVTYSVTFTKAGTYRFACLVHPLMVGEVVVQ
jgi:plastocyanin